MVKSKTNNSVKNEQNYTKISKNDSINTKKEAEKSINKIIIAKVPINFENKVPESESSIKKEQQNALKPR